MQIINARPPDGIDEKLGVVGKPVLFAYGAYIFNPKDIDIPPELEVHESVHGERQGNDIAIWWERYIADPAFRLAEEIPAHAAEYVERCKTLESRTQRRWFLNQLAKRLSGPLYGRLISLEKAKAAIKSAAKAVAA